MPIRDTIIVTIVVILAAIALRKPWLGVMNWTWLSIMSPHRYTWGFAYHMPLAAIAATSTLIGLILTKEKQSPFKGPPTVWLLMFAIWVTLSWVLGADPAGDQAQWDKVMKIYLMTFVSLALLRTKYQIMAFAWVTAGSIALLAAKGGVYTILGGGANRVWGPAGSFIEDNNHFALAAIITIPILHFLQLQLKKTWQKHLVSIVMLLSVASALGSHSRGALLALAAMGAVFWWRSTRKGAIGLLVVISALALLPMMPQHWWDRMETIQNYEEDASAMGRINAWLVAIEVAKAKPLGAGMSYQHPHYFALYGVHETIVRAAHSIYFQILGNHGFIGLFLYLMIWFSTIASTRKLRIIARRRNETKWAGELASMVQVSLVGYAVGGAFVSMPYYDFPLNLMVATVLAKTWVEKRYWESESTEDLSGKSLHV